MLRNIVVLFLVLSFLLNAKIAFASGQETNNQSAQDSQEEAALSEENYNLNIKNVWARASIPSSRNSAAYFEIVNNTDKEYVIISASTSVANNVELHNSFVDEKGISRMTSIDKVVVPAGSTIEFKPGGMHVMLFNLKKSFNQGDKFNLTLFIENSDPITVECEVRNQ